MSPDAESMAKLSTELRGNDGLGVTRLALKTAVALTAEAIDSGRALKKLEEIKKVSNSL